MGQLASKSIVARIQLCANTIQFFLEVWLLGALFCIAAEISYPRKQFCAITVLPAKSISFHPPQDGGHFACTLSNVVSNSPHKHLQRAQLEDSPPLVLHLHWQIPNANADDARLVLWAETADTAAPLRVRGRRAAHPKPKTHPFAVSDQSVIRQKLTCFDKKLITRGDVPLVLQLPATRSGPLPSPKLPHNWEVSLKDIRLEPWKVIGTRVPFASTLAILRHATECTCSNHFILSDEVFFWHKALILSMEILAQQQFVPSIKQQNEVIVAYWRPVFEAPDIKKKLRALARSMPPICRAELSDEGQSPSSMLLLKSFISRVVDVFARQWGNEAQHRILYQHNGQGVADWLKALIRKEGVIHEPDGRLQYLVSQVADWQRNLLPAGSTHYTIAFQLEAPPPSADDSLWHVPQTGWQLSYHLQSRSNPDLLIPAAQVWQTNKKTIIVQGLRFDHPQEKLLKGLGLAANIYPPIEQSLREPAPTMVALSTSQVYTFLRDAAPLLQQSGFHILFPPWWEQAGARLGLELHLEPITDEPPQTEDLSIAYHWGLVLGDTPLSHEAFIDLVNLRSPLVQQNNQWLRLDPEQIEAAQDFWERQSFDGYLNLKHGIRVALSYDEHTIVSGLPVHKVLVKGWLPQLIQKLSGDTLRPETVAQPAALNGQLRPYQRYGAIWLQEHYHHRLGAILADDMGLGKSVQTIAFLLHEQAEIGTLPGPTLLICPTSLLGNWRREIQRFAPALRVYTHYGPARARASDFSQAISDQDIILTSYALARRDIAFLHTTRWFGVILDEAQMIKNPKALITQAVTRLRADFRLALTGTPIENRLMELWSIFNFINPGYLHAPARFRKEYALPIENYQDPIALARLQRLVKPFILRRLKTDPAVIQDLPERLEMDVYCTLTDEQAEIYQQTVDEGLPRIADARGGQRQIHVFNLLTKLKQILNHPVQFHHKIGANNIPHEPLAGRSGKLDRLIAMLEELLAVGDKALIFTQFAEMGYLLSEHIRNTLEIPVLYLHGGIPGSKRQEMVNRFQDDPHAPPVFILTLKAGGLGLNLTAANHVFHYDRWWNPAAEKQAADRIFRIGQTRNVQIHKFVTAGTLEENIQEMLRRKQELAESIIGSDEGWLSTLSTDELVELISLQKEKLL